MHSAEVIVIPLGVVGVGGGSPPGGCSSWSAVRVASSWGVSAWAASRAHALEYWPAAAASSALFIADGVRLLGEVPLSKAVKGPYWLPSDTSGS
jgi:hypothetical protein